MWRHTFVSAVTWTELRRATPRGAATGMAFLACLRSLSWHARSGTSSPAVASYKRIAKWKYQANAWESGQEVWSVGCADDLGRSLGCLLVSGAELKCGLLS